MDVFNKYIDCIYKSFVGPLWYNPTQQKKDEFKNDLIKFLTTDFPNKDNNKNKLKLSLKNKLIKYSTIKTLFDCSGSDFEYIKRGTYGFIYKLNDKIVIKYPSLNNSICLDDSENSLIITILFIEEQVSNILLYCLYNEILYTFPHYIQCVPEIISIVKVESENGNHNLGSMMEKLEPIFKINMTLESLINYLIQIANALYYLQEKLQFMHRDLHSGNILMTKNPNQNKTIKLCTGDYLENQQYIIKIIDFGNVSMKIGDLEINTNSMNQPNYKKHVFNPTHDLRMLCASLYQTQIPKIFDVLYPFFNVDIKDIPSKSYFHHKYYSPVNIHDDNFLPKNFIRELLNFQNSGDLPLKMILS